MQEVEQTLVFLNRKQFRALTLKFLLKRFIFLVTERQAVEKIIFIWNDLMIFLICYWLLYKTLFNVALALKLLCKLSFILLALWWLLKFELFFLIRYFIGIALIARLLSRKLTTFLSSKGYQWLLCWDLSLFNSLIQIRGLNFFNWLF